MPVWMDASMNLALGEILEIATRTGKNGRPVIEPAEFILFEQGLKPVWRLSNITMQTCRSISRMMRAGGLHVVSPSSSYSFGNNGLITGPSSARDAMVWMFISRDKALAEEAARWDDVEKNSSGAKRREATGRIGALLGYPKCCIEAYQALPDLIHQTAHMLFPHFSTFGIPDSRLNRFMPFPYVLHSPCSFNCEASLELARRVEKSILNEAPQFALSLAEAKRAPLLYWKHGAIMGFDGESDGRAIRYGKVTSADLSSLKDSGRLREMISEGDKLTISDGALIISRGGSIVRALTPEDTTAGYNPFILHWDTCKARRRTTPKILFFEASPGSLSEYRDFISSFGINNVTAERDSISTHDANDYNICVTDIRSPGAIAPIKTDRSAVITIGNVIAGADNCPHASNKAQLLDVIRDITEYGPHE